MSDTLKFLGLMFLICASLTAGTTFLVHKAFNEPNWVKWLLMPLMMFAYSMVAVYISDWFVVVRKAGKSIESSEMELKNAEGKGQDA